VLPNVDCTVEVADAKPDGSGKFNLMLLFRNAGERQFEVGIGNKRTSQLLLTETIEGMDGAAATKTLSVDYAGPPEDVEVTVTDKSTGEVLYSGGVK